jgi:hypothetical protein
MLCLLRVYLCSGSLSEEFETFRVTTLCKPTEFSEKNVVPACYLLPVRLMLCLFFDPEENIKISCRNFG